MGDLTTHATIGRKVMSILQHGVPKDEKGQPMENYMFFELGNFLTDLSQLRDPPAHVGGKIKVWKEGCKEHGGWILRNVADLDGYLVKLMGTSKTHGALATFLMHFSYFWGCERFRKENPPIAPKDFERVFKYIQGESYYTGYSQYWPHEHFDFPPTLYNNAIGDRSKSKADQHFCISPEQAKTGVDDSDRTQVPSLSLAGAHFEFDKTFILPSAKEEILRIYQLKQTHTDRKMAIFGHTDAVSSDDYNNRLSKLRGQSAYALLTKDYSWWMSHLDGSPVHNEKPWGTREIQHMLNALNFYNSTIDGNSYKDNTRQAIRDFQASVGLTSSSPGRVDNATRRKLVEAYMNELLNGSLTPPAFFQDSNGRPAVFGCGEAYLQVQAQRKNPQNRRVVFVLRRKEGAPVDLSKVGKDVPYQAWLAPETEPPPQASPPAKPADKTSQQKRKVLKYIEDQIEFCAELLTIVEQEWRELTVQPDSPANRNDRNKFIALFGHVSHIVEDFFFHSNFIDKAWERLKKDLPLDGQGVRSKRLFLRRLRSPKGIDHDQKLSVEDSDYIDIVYSGGFGAQDIFFTVNDALKTLLSKHDINSEPWFVALPKPAQDVIRPFFDDKARKRLTEKDSSGQYKNEKERELWFKGLREFVNNADAILNTATLARQITGNEKIPHETSLQALRKMCEIDRNLYNEYNGPTGVPEYILGPFAFLLELLSQVDQAVEASAEQSKILDNRIFMHEDNLHQTVKPTDNGAGHETIGSHSVMNKDSARKQPLFYQTLNVATCVSCYIASVMVRQVNQQRVPAARFDNPAEAQTSDKPKNTVKTPSNIDWLHLLQHFLCHPDECEKQWQVEAMQNKDAPTYHIIKHVDRATINERMKLKKRDHLKTIYKTYGDAVEDQWEKEVRK